MSYRIYFDLVLRPDPEIPPWDRMSALWRAVHRASARSNTPFAVAFPKWMAEGFTLGETLRVFTTGEDRANALYDALEQQPRWDDLATGSRVRSAPAHATSFEAYRMHRLPSGVAKKRRTVPLDVAQALQARARDRRLKQQAAYPFVIMRSSSGHRFRLVIERLAADPGQSGEPNGYGLSRATQLVALPVV
jgi:CRISPR-associated endoribonuclease Cas6/Csy4 subtype I-F